MYSHYNIVSRDIRGYCYGVAFCSLFYRRAYCKVIKLFLMIINLLDIPAFFVNLPHQVDRREKTESVLAEWGHKNFICVPGKYSQEDEWPWAGQSRAYSDACSRSDTPFILFEDDINLLNRLSSIEIPDDADAVYLGGSVSHSAQTDPKAYRTNYDGVVRVTEILTNHAILYISKPLVDEYRNLLKAETRADIVMSSLSHRYNFYAINPVIFYQDDWGVAQKVNSMLTLVRNYLTKETYDRPEISHDGIIIT